MSNQQQERGVGITIALTFTVRTFIQDLRFGFRMALRSPGFTLIAVLTLAAGIAANSTVFSWIDGVILHPIPGVADPASLVAFESVAPNGDALATSYPDYRDYRDHLKLISGLAGSTPSPFNIGQDVRSDRAWGELVTGNYFAVLGVKPVLGRVFAPDEYGDAQGAHPVVVIGERFWKRRFNADPGIVGKQLRVMPMQYEYDEGNGRTVEFRIFRVVVNPPLEPETFLGPPSAEQKGAHL